jgi:hypothetical protein
MTLDKPVYLQPQQIGGDKLNVQRVAMSILVNLNATVFWNDEFVDRIEQLGIVGECPPEKLIRVPVCRAGSPPNTCIQTIDPNGTNALRIELEDAGGESFFDLTAVAFFD